jgi:PAS domain S-box-containing protein
VPLPLIEQALSSLNDVVLITEAEPFALPGPSIVWVNTAFERMSGYTAVEVIGLTPRILQGPRTSRTELDRLGAALSRWESCRVAVTNYRKDGRPFDVEFDVVPVADERGWFTHWVSMQRDTTLQTVAAAIIARAESVDALVSGVLREAVEYADVDGACWETRAAGTDALALASSAAVETSLSAPKTNWPTMEPTRPIALSTPRLVVRCRDGKASVERQSSAFHEHVETALSEQAASSTVASVAAKGKTAAHAHAAASE